MKANKYRKMKLLFCMLFILMFLFIGYASLTTTLQINGVADVDSASWNVYWDHVQVLDGSVSGDLVTQAPLIDSDKTSVSYHVRLKEPGDYYAFTVDAVNDGSLDAMIDSISLTINNQPISNLPKYLQYEFTYGDGMTVEEKHLLHSNQREIYRFYIKYRDDIDPSDLPKENTPNNINVNVEYIQSGPDGHDRDNYVFSYDTSKVFKMNQPVPENAVVYDNYQDAVTSFGHPFFMRYLVSDNVILDTYLGFIINDNVYYVHGAPGQEYRASNGTILEAAFGAENCIYDEGIAYSCSINSPSYLHVLLMRSGYNYADDSSHFCGINDDLESGCNDKNA